MRHDSPLISVIIPVYNGEKFLRQCLESVGEQTYRNIEIVVVDDGSTDGSCNIISDMAIHDRRIKLLKQENCGPSAARNRGIDNARGEFLTFVDADDRVDPRYVEVLYILLATNDAEMSACNFTCDESHLGLTSEGYDVVDGKGYIADVLYKRYSDNSSWAKMYSKALWNDVRFLDMRYEDLEIFPRVCYGASKVVITDAPLYYYRPHDKSFMHSVSESRFDALTATELIEKFLHEREAGEQLYHAGKARHASACFNAMLISYGKPQYLTYHTRAWDGIKRLRAAVILDSEASWRLRAAAMLSFGGRRPLHLLNKLLHISR